MDVARESADIILLRRDLDVLRSGVEDGRRTFANTLKYISITTSANFGNMVSMALATPLLPFLPLADKQILLNNLLAQYAENFENTGSESALNDLELECLAPAFGYTPAHIDRLLLDLPALCQTSTP